MFTASLFAIAKIWKQPMCLSTDEWIRKIQYTYTMEYYLAIKKNEVLLFATTWMDLEGIMLCEISQTKKREMLYDFNYMWNLEKTEQVNKHNKTESQRYREQTGGYQREIGKDD